MCNGGICIYRTQDLDSIDDPYCCGCWYESEDVKIMFLSREECYEANCVSEEEFNDCFQTRQRYPKSVTLRAEQTDKG